jgi:uncharacterized protein (DUF4415 family)
MSNQAKFHLQSVQYSAEEGKADMEAVKRQRAPGGGRKPKKEGELYVSISMRLHPKALEWAKAEASKRGIGYQSLINEILLERVAT